MPRYYESSAAVCPFYRGEQTTAQFCDGFRPGMTIKISFKDEKGAKTVKHKYCRASWAECPLAKALTECNKG